MVKDGEAETTAEPIRAVIAAEYFILALAELTYPHCMPTENQHASMSKWFCGKGELGYELIVLIRPC